MKIFHSLFIFLIGAALLLPAVVFLGISALFGKLAGLFDTASWWLEETADALNQKWRTKYK
ncbi:hypothetical protein OH491_16925 [Termitidicoccus mucosus]|uniref:Uncharacterized protein n=1 Tax=Termitidicoccus mucosus TaxID=1184151 RepID=A0A178ILF3_9BACT|nr:hypothetical protein AW736_11665 [Opitutaceae bacterium TSB47]